MSLALTLCQGSTTTPEPNTAEPISITAYGAQSNGPDATAAIKAAIEVAQTTSHCVYVPPGTYSCQALKLDGVIMRGDGPNSILVAPDPAHAQVVLTGIKPGLMNLKFYTKATQRHGEQGRIEVDSKAESFVIDHVTEDGSNGGGIMIYGHTGRITRNQIINTKADGIHMTGDAHELYVAGNRVQHSGDDCISVVTYDLHNTNPDNCHDILIENNEVSDQLWGRGITVVGGDHVTIRNNIIRKTAMAGIYLASESSYHTRGVSNVIVENNQLDSTPYLYPQSRHPALLIYSNSQFTVTDIKIIHNFISKAPNGPFRIVKSARNIYFSENKNNGLPVQPSGVTGTGQGVTGATVTASLLGERAVPLPSVNP